MHTLKGLIVLVAVICCATGLDLPPDFQKCKRSDNNVNECLKAAIQDALPKLKDGLPAFGFPKIQPLDIPSITVGEGKGAVHVIQNFNDVKIYGIPLAVLDKVDAKLTDTSVAIDISATLKEVKIEAKYDFNGRILLLPIVGNGNSAVQFENVKAQVHFGCKLITKKNKGYIDCNDVTIKLDPQKIVFNFDNLFNGDERLGTEMNRLLNDNWKEIWEDVKHGYEDSLSIIIQDIGNKIIKKVPYDDLIP
ncbi:hypothetical protein ILUMI_05360 [Ignelater luminosus]|uniref:Uncharacterized protein n=1 Tax=Ignelater luminosus TaxID=2038154 RepID=A0A8K0DB65_IGNLU|nr:hypothetical protein ILUMI_05360 [Ignelater luminosus]